MRTELGPQRSASAPPIVAAVHKPRVEPRSRVERLCEAYEHAGPTLRAHVLQRMIGCVGSLALAAIARGAFARHLLPSFEGTVAVSGEDVEATRLEHVRELARYVEQSDPRRFASIVDELVSFSQSRVRGLAPL